MEQKRTLIVDMKSPIRENGIEFVFLRICDELAEKIPEKEPYFRSLQRECRECVFNIVPNMSDLVATYLDILDRGTVTAYARAVGRGDR